MNIPPIKTVHTRKVSPEEERFYRELVGQLVAKRKERRISQAELDQRLGMSEGMVAKWESMARLPGAFFLMCWANALGVRFVVEAKGNA